MITRLQSHEDFRVPGIGSRASYGFNFGMGHARGPVVALTDYLAVPDDNRADRRVGRSPPESSSCQFKGTSS